ncbi:MAG: nucleotidyl transferase AbiEii/AbiGii toxin family protein [Verrucomicrobiota bacterium]
MKDYIREIVSKAADRLLGRSMAREYCQARILQALQDGGAFRTWVFCGGTALRFLYGLPRYSGDLDFALTSPAASVAFAELLDRIPRVLETEGYRVSVKPDERRTVKSAFVRFEGLLHDVGLSPHASEVLAVKIELDARPPAGGTAETTVVRKHVLLNLLHYTKPCLLAGKLHAVLARSYAKGRDLYDLLWYLSDRNWPGPDIAFLQNALEQTGWTGTPVTSSNWRHVVAERLDLIDWSRIVEDARPFLERTGDADLLRKEHLLSLLR